MSIRYLPGELLKKMMPDKVVARLVTKDLTLNRAAVTSLSRSGVLGKKKLTDVAIKVIRGYRERYGDERKAGTPKAQALDEVLNDKKQMVQRVKNSAVKEITKEIKSQYRGEYYTWLPSEANIPDPLHQLNYGLTFQIGVGEMPGDREGCMCGMEILVDDEELDLE